MFFINYSLVWLLWGNIYVYLLPIFNQVICFLVIQLFRFLIYFVHYPQIQFCSLIINKLLEAWYKSFVIGVFKKMIVNLQNQNIIQWKTTVCLLTFGHSVQVMYKIYKCTFWPWKFKTKMYEWSTWNLQRFISAPPWA